ncbi:MAG: hypothetical protein HZB29_14315 [Nitrospinae bacterium]|nr:hypothetical protein [Nitrospinota bacterium]
MKTNILRAAAILSLIPLMGCAQVNPALVSVGLAEPIPPVTDSNYFNTQMNTLLDRVKTAQLRAFRKAATIEFVNANGQVSELGRYLTAKFGERAMGRGQFRVIPQGQVKEAFTKLKIAPGPELTKDQLEKLGTEIEADAIVTGVVSDLQKGSDVDLTVKVIQPSTGEMIAAASVNIYRSKQVQTLIQQF